MEAYADNCMNNQAYGSKLSHIFDIPSILIFSIWYTKCIIWYTQYIISNVTFTFWETWHNYYKYVIPGILHEKLRLTTNVVAGIPCQCYIKGICWYLSVTFAQFKVLLFWSCLSFPDLLWNLAIRWWWDKWDNDYEKDIPSLPNDYDYQLINQVCQIRSWYTWLSKSLFNASISIYLVYQFQKFDVPSGILLNIPGISEIYLLIY